MVAPAMDEPDNPGCSACRWWGTETENYHHAETRTCTWPKPFWMDHWQAHRDNILSRGCKTWERRE